MTIFPSLLQMRWIYHLLFWVLYSGFWYFIFARGEYTLFGVGINLVYLVCNACPAYINIYGLMPRWLYTRKFVVYLLLLAINIAFFSLLLRFLLLHVFDLAAFENVLNTAIIGSTFGSVSSAVFIVSSIKLMKRQMELVRQKQAAEKSALSSELNFLKSQLNPHFMFNALNNIYFLIKKDPDTAADALAQYSDILRYQIYDCNEKYIPLQEEITFLQNYIQISQLRKNRLQLHVEFPQQLNGEKIAPLLLLPFIENAFKHVSDEKEQLNQINIRLQIVEQQLELLVDNTMKEAISTSSTLIKEASGIGLANVQRRLELLYPNQHTLTCKAQANQYMVYLKLPIQ